MSDNVIQPDSTAQSATVKICMDPVFIVGCDRSGTTILARSLGRHSHLRVSDETDILFHLFGEGRAQKAYDLAIQRPSGNFLQRENVERDEFFQYLGLGINALFTSRSGDKRWVDHTPCYTAMLEPLAKMFPGAKFIHILRDGRRVVHSMINIMNTFNEANRIRMVNEGYVPSYVNFEPACRRWQTFVEAALSFEGAHPERCLTVVNEELVAEPVKQFARIFEFIDAPYQDAPVEFFQTNRINSSFRRDSRDASWVKEFVNPWDEWSVNQKQTFRRIAGMTMTRCGLATAEDLTLSDYDHMVLEVQAAAQQVCHRGAKVIVINAGDPQLLELGEVSASSFPQDETGKPADDAVAILRIEAQRQSGVEYLAIPQTERWWLEFYEGFHQHLLTNCQLVWQSDACTIFKLHGGKSARSIDQGGIHEA